MTSMNVMLSSLPQSDSPTLVRLLEVGKALNSAATLQQLLQMIVVEAADLTMAEASAITLVDLKTGESYCKASSWPLNSADFSLPVPASQTLAGMVMRTHQPQQLLRAIDSPLKTTHSFITPLKITDALAVPLFDGSEIIGTIEVINKRRGVFDEESIDILVALANWAGVIVSKSRLIDELTKVNEELAAMDRIKNEFIAVASHELQSPLAVILGYASFLREQAQDQETSHQLDRVIKAAMRLRSLMQDMLSLRYVDAGETELDLSHFDMATFIVKVAKSRLDVANAKVQKITFHISDERLPVIGDREMLEVVFDTLLNNAIKFTPQGGEITVSAERQGQFVQVCIQDTGMGIPKKDLDRIFGRFYQVEPNLRRKNEGLGLGLAIAKDLIALHDGQIWAESELGEGSRFYVTLPLVRLRAY